MAYHLPAVLAPYFVVTEVAAADRFMEDTFRRKFGDPAPDFPHHIVAFCIEHLPHMVPVSYVHFRPFEDVYLVGGGLTDGNALRQCSQAAKDAFTQADGLLEQTLRYGFDRFAPHCRAIFGYCGDARAEVVDLRAGFQKTPIKHLLIHQPHPLTEQEEQSLIAKVAAIGPF